MRRKGETKSKGTPDDKVLDINATMEGTLRFDEPVNLRVSGNFDGTLDTKGKLMIGPKAIVKANITGETISIAGNVTGNIKASKLISLEPSARLYGDLETPKFAVEEGAILTGQIRMENTSATSSNSKKGSDLMNAFQVASYLEVAMDKVTEWAKKGELPAAKDGSDWIFDKDKVDEWVAQGRIKE
jgi:excisionase family DNA binding protein